MSEQSDALNNLARERGVIGPGHPECLHVQTPKRGGIVAANGAVLTVSNLNKTSTIVDTPTSESVVRPLAPLPPEKQREAWQSAVESLPVYRRDSVPVTIDPDTGAVTELAW